MPVGSKVTAQVEPAPTSRKAARMTEFWTLLRGWADTRPGGMNDSQIARALGVQTQRVSKWKKGATPRPDQLRQVSELTGIEYSRILHAVMIDEGYLPKDGETDGRDSAPNTEAG